MYPKSHQLLNNMTSLGIFLEAQNLNDRYRINRRLIRVFFFGAGSILRWVFIHNHFLFLNHVLVTFKQSTQKFDQDDARSHRSARRGSTETPR